MARATLAPRARVAVGASFLLIGLAAASPAPPPLSTLAGTSVAPDENPRDMPTITNFWGSVGTSQSDLLGLSQVLLPPFLDVGAPTARVRIGSGPTAGCAPETIGPWTIGGDDQFFYLVSSNDTVRTYNLTCTTPGCTSWHNATGVMLAPFTTVHIVFGEIPPHTPFDDTGTFDDSCTVLPFVRSGGSWCASSHNPSCTPKSDNVAVQGWQWTPTGVVRWGGPGRSETRMLFEGNGILQRLAVTAGPDSALADLSVSLTGAMRAYPGGLSWTTGMPGVGSDFANTSLPSPTTLLACDAASVACTAWAFVDATLLFPNGTLVPVSMSVALAAGQAATATATFPPIPASATLTFSAALVVAATEAGVLALAAEAAGTPQAFQASWDAFPALWEQRWEDAFTPKGNSSGGSAGSGHFSGSFPVLSLDESPTGVALSRLYYMGCLTLLTMERTNLPLVAPRTYVTGTGTLNCGFEIGGTMRFFWDGTFYAGLLALLDPVAQKPLLSLYIGQPIASVFGVELDNGQVGGDFYAFNALSIYRSFSAYLRTTNDTDFLEEVLAGGGGGRGARAEAAADTAAAAPAATPTSSYLDTLVDFYLAYVRSPATSTLADYSGGANNYLECVPSYIHATAGLQGGNAFMARDLAELREAQGNATGAALLRARADAIALETVERMYVSNTTSGRTNGTAPGDIGGWFRVVDTSPGGAGTAEVRHVVDTAYAPMGLCNPRWGPAACAFNATVRAQMVDFALRQLAVPGSGSWIRALSLLDAVAPIDRPDHGTTGAYPAWPSMLADAMVGLEGGFGSALPFLANLAQGAEEGPFGQASAVAADGVGVFKTSGGCIRYIADDGTAFAESILRVVFGYEPGFGANAPGAPGSTWTPSLPSAPRGTLSGSMRCVRAPASDPGAAPQYLSLTLTNGVVGWAWDAGCV
jgi:hypothetical protein